MSLVRFNFESQYLGNNQDVLIILPDKPRNQTPEAFYGSGRKYKVLWLLHGTFGDCTDWIRKSSVELYACEKDLIVVMPSAMNSMYCGWPAFATGYYWEDYFFSELMPVIFNWFPASSAREDNFIAGLSMGGDSGALKLSLMHPERFAAAAVLSSSPKDLHTYGKIAADPKVNPRYYNNIMNFGSLERYIASDENTWDIIRQKHEAGADLPRLYFCCGREDAVAYKNYLAFKKYAQGFGLRAVFEEEEGYSHEWRFWDKSIQKALTFFGLDQRDAGNPF